jgi:hypothetical protein
MLDPSHLDSSEGHLYVDPRRNAALKHSYADLSEN